jgi:hypothetical protein
MLSLFLPALYPIQAGDTCTIRPGFDKSFGTCRAKFDNVVNFRGFPHVPGTDQVLSYPDAEWRPLRSWLRRAHGSARPGATRGGSRASPWIAAD